MLSPKNIFTNCVVILCFVLSVFWISQTTILFAAVDCGGNGDCQSIQKDIENLSRDLQSSVNATTNLEQQVALLDSRIKSIQNGISKAKARADIVSKNIANREDRLAKQYTLFTGRVREQYKRSLSFSPFYLIFSSGSATDFTRQLAYRQSIQQQDQQIIHTVGQEIITLEQDKKNLEAEQARLAGLQKQLDTQAAFFKKEIAGKKTEAGQSVIFISRVLGISHKKPGLG